jgi:enterochelin esterase-like enzyme
VLTPDSAAPLPLCILLLGLGGTRDALADLQPVFEGWWSEGIIPPMIVAVPTPRQDYYLNWDSFLVDELLPRVRATSSAGEVTVIAGISGGGYGALKLAFAHPHRFAAVAAMQPMLEPGLRETDVGARNRLHHSAGGPPQLIGAAPIMAGRPCVPGCARCSHGWERCCIRRHWIRRWSRPRWNG